jgi:hypothetical protein
VCLTAKPVKKARRGSGTLAGMRRTRTCPKCEGRRFFDIQETTLPDQRSQNGTFPLTAAADYLPSGEKTWAGTPHTRLLAQLQAFVCATCGYTELNVDAAGLRVLAYMAQRQAATVRHVDFGR